MQVQGASPDSPEWALECRESRFALSFVEQILTRFFRRDLASLMNNPALMGMAQQLMQNGGLGKSLSRISGLGIVGRLADCLVPLPPTPPMPLPPSFAICTARRTHDAEPVSSLPSLVKLSLLRPYEDE